MIRTLAYLALLLLTGCATLKYEEQTDTERRVTEAVDILFDIIKDLDKVVR